VPDHPDIAGPAPARVHYSPAEQVAWYATLATMFGAAAALFTDPAGRVLLVKPNYRDHWSLPGGLLDQGEPPQAGCRREVQEELGLRITPGPLLTIDWVPPDEIRPRPIVHFIFDGGELDDDVAIELQHEELDDYRFVEPGDLASYLPPVIASRVTAALRSRAAGGAAYLHPLPPARSAGSARPAGLTDAEASGPPVDRAASRWRRPPRRPRGRTPRRYARQARGSR
jgi:8-oxo-dGTP diphosphatase